MADETVEFLMMQAHRFRARVHLVKMEEKLQSSATSDRLDAALFTVYHLLVSGAVSEANIDEFLQGGGFAPAVSRFADELDVEATRRAWRGTAYGDSPNIIGSLAFLVVVMFLFEGFAKLALGEDRIRRDVNWKGMVGMAAVVKWLRCHSPLNEDTIRAVEFLNRYRNGWHNFGFYRGEEIPWRHITLRDGKMLPPIPSELRLELLAELFTAFLSVDDLRRTP